MGTYEIFQRVGQVACEVKFPSELVSVHQVVNVSNLKKCMGDPAKILSIEGLGLQKNLSYEEV